MRQQTGLDSADLLDSPYPRPRRLGANRFRRLSCLPKWRDLSMLRDLIRSLPVHSASTYPSTSRLPVPLHSRLRFVPLGMTRGVRNRDIRHGIPFVARTGPAHSRFPDTRRFCLRNF